MLDKIKELNETVGNEFALIDYSEAVRTITDYLINQDLKQDKRTKEYVNDLKEQRDKYKDALSVKIEEYEELKKNFVELDKFRTKQSLEYDLLVAEKERMEESIIIQRELIATQIKEIDESKTRYESLYDKIDKIERCREINSNIRGMKVNY